MRIGIVTGEPSGDRLGASLIQALSTYYPALELEGILGPQLLSLDRSSALYPMDRLSVIGLVEPLFRIPELFWIRHQLIQHFLKNPPDVFIGIDSPDFNLGLELRIKERSNRSQHPIPMVHYVSPTVWAWRSGRIHTIKKAVDLMLALFPFEEKFYQEQGIPVCFTGHPLADQLPLQTDTKAAKLALGFRASDTVMILLPGSRDKELYYLAESYLKIAQWCYQKRKDLVFVVPLVNKRHVQWFKKQYRQQAPELPLKILLNDAQTAIAACDVALVKAGTSTLEVMLHKKPMVATYRMNPLTYQIARRLVKIPYLTLPNLLAEEKLFPEFLQNEVTPERVGPELLKFLEGGKAVSHLKERFTELHHTLRRDASQTAAKAIVERIN